MAERHPLAHTVAEEQAALEYHNRTGSPGWSLASSSSPYQAFLAGIRWERERAARQCPAPEPGHGDRCLCEQCGG